MPVGLNFSEVPDGAQIERCRSLHRPKRPKKYRDSHSTLVRWVTRRSADIGPVREKGAFKYSIHNGKLFLSLPADGGIYVFQPFKQGLGQ
jgi:hypothetical protein